MVAPSPAEIGMPAQDVDTPALVLDLDILDRNLKRMAESAERAGVRLRPHAKAHKCPMIARRQMALGAVGVCCQKVSEAEAMVEGGVPDVLVTYEVVGEPKVRRLAALARRARVAVIADHPEQVAAYSRAAGEYGVTLSVMADIYAGGPRTGVEPGKPAVDLALRIAEASGLRFGGLQAYNGAAQHVRDHAERREVYAAYAAKVSETRQLLEDAGLACETISGGGTGTSMWEAESGIFTELQPGSYVFMDADYAPNLDEEGRPWRGFEHSLFILTAVMSCRSRDYALVDAGTKAANVDIAMPLVCELPGAMYSRPSDEHGVLELSPEAGSVRLGQKLRMIPGHCDPTVNLHDWIVCIRNGAVEAVWPVSGRGAIL